MKADTRQPVPPFRRRIPSHLGEIETLCSDLRAHLDRHHLSQHRFSVELVARECLNNGILHGNRQDPRKHAELHLRVGPRWIRLQVADEGPGYPWRRHRPPTVPDETRPNGRGLALCTSYATRVRHNHLGNRITLWIPR